MDYLKELSWYLALGVGAYYIMWTIMMWIFEREFYPKQLWLKGVAWRAIRGGADRSCALCTHREASTIDIPDVDSTEFDKCNRAGGSKYCSIQRRYTCGTHGAYFSPAPPVPSVNLMHLKWKD